MVCCKQKNKTLLVIRDKNTNSKGKHGEISTDIRKKIFFDFSLRKKIVCELVE